MEIYRLLIGWIAHKIWSMSMNSKSSLKSLSLPLSFLLNLNVTKQTFKHVYLQIFHDDLQWPHPGMRMHANFGKHANDSPQGRSPRIPECTGHVGKLPPNLFRRRKWGTRAEPNMAEPDQIESRNGKYGPCPDHRPTGTSRVNIEFQLFSYAS